MSLLSKKNTLKTNQFCRTAMIIFNTLGNV